MSAFPTTKGSADELGPPAGSRRDLRYASTSASATSPTGTRRRLPPLPRTLKDPRWRSMSPSLSAQSSLTRSPAAYMSESMARSRRPRGLDTSGVASSRTTSSKVRTAGSRRPSRGGESSAVGSEGESRSRTRKRQKPRIADKCRAAERADSPALSSRHQEAGHHDRIELLGFGHPSLFGKRSQLARSVA